MIMLLLGILDLLIAVLAGLMAFGIFFKTIAFIAGAYLVIKGILFIKSFASILDLIAGIAIIVGLYVTLQPALLLIVAVYLAQKAIFSFF